MCHVVSSNSYKNLQADKWIQTSGEKRLEAEGGGRSGKA